MSIRLGDIVERLNGQLKNGDPDMSIQGIAPFDHANSGWITFAIDRKILQRINDTKADAIIVSKQLEARSDINKALILVDNPYAAFAKAAQFFLPQADYSLGIHEKAVVDETVKMGPNVSIEPGVVIEKNAILGDNVIIRANSVIGEGVQIGNDVYIYPNATILNNCIIGNRVIIHSGSVIGSDGFGFAPDGERYEKVPQTGIVQIDDDVEIGANNTIDRATFGKTWIKKGVKTDNQVHIAHNVVVGENSVLVAQVGIAGSTTIGQHCVIAGQSGISGHISIGDNVTIGPKAGIAQSVEDNMIMSGNIAMPHKLWLRVQKIIPKLPDLKKQITRLEKLISEKAEASFI